jgi:hypothetical protein
VELTDQWERRLQRQDHERSRLEQGLGVPVVSLPFLFHRELTGQDLVALSRALGVALDGLGRRPR